MGVVDILVTGGEPGRGTLLWNGTSYPCTLGRSGVAAAKREGDGASPTGCFPLRAVFYRADTPPQQAQAERLYGRAAVAAYVEGIDGRLMRSMKSILGSSLLDQSTDIGAGRSLDYLRRSLLQPSETILAQNRSIRAVTRDGATITGRRLNEDTHTIQLLDSQERLVSLVKSDLREIVTLTASPMPSYQDKLTPQELSDLLTYLLNRKGQ